MVKLTGADWNAFMDDKAEWPDGAWFQDEGFALNGEWGPEGWSGDSVPPEAKVQVTGGEFYPSDKDREFFPLERKLRRWLKARAVTVIVLEVANDRLDAVFGLLEHPSIKVLSPARGSPRETMRPRSGLSPKEASHG